MQRATLLDVGRSRAILDSVNLLTMKAAILHLKEQILNTLKTLADEDLNSLKLPANIGTSTFFEDVFELASIYKKIDQAQMITNQQERGWALRDISKALTQQGNIDKAIVVASTIPDQSIVNGF